MSGLEPVNYMSKLKPWIPEDYVTSIDDFKNKMNEMKNAKVFGKILSEFKTKSNRGILSTTYNCLLEK